MKPQHPQAVRRTRPGKPPERPLDLAEVARTVKQRLADALAARSPTAAQDHVTIRFAYGEWMPTRIVGHTCTVRFSAGGGPTGDKAYPVAAVYVVE